jgi:hypothetical protein
VQPPLLRQVIGPLNGGDELSGRALARVIAATADDADRPTKLARQMSPQSFYLWPVKDEPTAGADL